MSRFLIAATVVAALLLSTVTHAEQQVAPYRYSEAYRSHNYARASHCSASSLSSWSCGPICDKIPGFQFYTTVGDSWYDTFGFIGVDHTNKQIVVAFRGSVTVMNWVQDLVFTFVDYVIHSSCRRCRVHKGFLASYLSVRSQVKAAVTTLLSRHPGYQVLAAGHSLGGALAVHAAVDLQVLLDSMAGPTAPVALYTLGAPRVGNPSFAKWTAQILARGPHYRLTHCRDPVPHMPPMSFGFLHAPSEVFYRTRSNSSMRMCNDSPVKESSKCSNSMFAVSFTDHLKYFGEDADCSCRNCRSAALKSVEVEPKLPKWLYARLAWEQMKMSTGILNATTLE
ncbi:hypothetical protein LSCM1_02647 [Leishmania martiniquensis]|uniref:Fungal lipase-type domain-containing protein n=1 Tax=Leishmania martiniquensis TaxID=1580590 RepID=A0A836GA11_9TRYP|nr:hypothetical protein LSCM1_02642 [Leishmania martiniquensis]KAG5469424.1 hypothetical protein LSCM1_02643 [Leishmania martiniquensis]KAG5469425.1 hypothetical protein LSCM1_02644 [Leishmania martiniquensis]KAG5469426.1 hypothetical protein LSCM1_02645 [Leishmania martiniquensis]KAG5469427.1 hypothetical protein LSCM1_02646 [Leishmania martiniquensis]